ncbi:MAG: alpha-amylase family glycosyl hydrolase [Candidatus Nanopelagicaceae bacterium]
MRRNFALFLSVFALLLPTSSFASNELVDTYRTGLDKEVIYFVMPDRYRNGDTSNDNQPGFNPTHTAFFHGGDLRGLTGNCKDDDGLARLKNLGFTAIWMTPLVVQQPPTEGGAGYHGYWGVDFLNVEPRLGSNDDLVKLSECAKKLGLKLILDVVTNHTGDIIWYNGREPYIPEKFKGIKNPAWLNEISNYHNAGDMNNCWSGGSCTRDGDFFGLDDLATEKEVVYRGFADIYGEWIDRYGFEGFRVDTARHVDTKFFKNWSPLINKAAEQKGISDFTIFGEVWEPDPIALMNFIRVNKMQTALDFPFQRVAVDYAASSSSASVLENLFAYDDYYTSSNSSASSLVTFLGNHDMGRVAFLINAKRVNPQSQLLARVKLAHVLLYLSRGIPTVYYGDEVGMTGSENGNDQRARQDMFPTQVEMWKNEPRVGSKPVKDGDSFSEKSHPISDLLKNLGQLRKEHQALANGQMQIRYAKGPLFIFSKRAVGENTEYLIALNNSSKKVSATVPTATSGNWEKLLGSASFEGNRSEVSISLSPFGYAVLRGKKGITETTVNLGKLSSKTDFLSGFEKLSASVATRDLATAEFLIRSKGKTDWVSVGVDLNRPYSVYINPEDFSGNLEFKAIITNSKGAKVEFKPRALSITAP